MQSIDKIYLNVRYVEKEHAKRFGARWNPDKKQWYYPGEVLPPELECYLPIDSF